MTESDRDKTLQVMARGDADLLPQIMALVEEYATAKSILTLKAERGPTDGYALALSQASTSYRKIGNLLDAFGEAHLTALEASGRAVVSVGPLKAGVAAYADIALQDALNDLRDDSTAAYDDEVFLKAFAGNGFRVIPASPYGKAVVQEASAEARSAVANSKPVVKEDSE